MRINKKVVAGLTVALTVAGGATAWAVLTIGGSGSGEGAVAGADRNPIMLSADIEADWIFDDPEEVAYGWVIAQNPAANKHKYRVTLDEAAPLTVTVGTMVGDDSATIDGTPEGVKCSSLLQAGIETSEPQFIWPGDTAGVGEVAISWVDPTDLETVTNGCLGKVVTVEGLVSR